MDLEFNGKKAIVTGGARGIGKRIGQLLLDEGASLAFCSRSAESIADCEREWGAAGHRVFGSVVDVGDAAAYRAWLAKSVDDLGGCDAFVHNVSAGGGTGEDKWRLNFEVDLMGAVRGMEALEPHLAENGGAAVFIVSTAAVEHFPLVQPYNALKASLIVYAKQLSQLLAPQGVRLNCVSPGATTFPGGSWERHRDERPAYFESTLAKIPSGRLGTPEEIADAVGFLLSPRASWITGINLIVDGGQTKRVSL